MLFHGSGAWPASAAALEVAKAHRALFDDDNACFFGVSIDPDDVSAGRIEQMLPGVRWFLDDDRKISTAYGAVEEAGARCGIARTGCCSTDRCESSRGSRSRRGKRRSPHCGPFCGRIDEPASAPALIVPRVFEPELCRELIQAYDRDGGHESGFMREVDGVTVERSDHAHKRRSDFLITDPELTRRVHARISRLLAPQIKRAFQFEVTRIERLLVACYNGDEGGGHFRPHRDNTTKGTAHRRFACTINLNAEDYEGGDLAFPEFGQRTYRAPTGGAVIFSCSLLHEARPVLRGKRYAFLPFFYDEAGAKVREENLPFVAPELQGYRAGIGEA